MQHSGVHTVLRYLEVIMLRRRGGKDSSSFPSSPVVDDDEEKRTETGGLASVVGLCLPVLLLVLVWYSLRPWNSSSSGSRGSGERGKVLYSPEDLASANDGGSRHLLVVVGRVFDVSKGMQHYGPGSPYSGFLGRDGSRAFVTGDFSENGFSDDVSDFTAEQCVSLRNWEKFYEDDDKYPEVGNMIGRYYDTSGEPTQALLAYHACVTEGGKVWCSEGLVPRKPKEEARELFGKPNRCACFDLGTALTNSAMLEGYEGCEVEASECITKKPGER